jgi:hypothetical protein
MPKLTYVGKKPSAIDNITGSRVVWNGHGDVQEVTDAQARSLLKFPDQWELTDFDADSAALEAPLTHAVAGLDGVVDQVPDEDLKKPIDKMTKPELIALGLSKFKKKLDPSWSKKNLLDAIEELQRNGE